MKIIAIVTGLPPAIDGVGDYALRLAQQIYQDHGWSTHFIVGDPNWSGQIDLPGISAVKVAARSAEALLVLLTKYNQTSTTVLLQFSGYGYAKRSCCFWLVEGLAQWQQQTAQARLVTMFHEIYSAFGVPWRHHFWVSPIQRYLSARLMQMSDVALTNTELHGEMLHGLGGRSQRQISILPVLSNIGEPQTILPLSERKRCLVIFGQAGSRIQAYRDSSDLIEFVCRCLEIKQILDIGQPTGMNLQSVGEVQLLEMGTRSAPEISEILQTSMVGFLSYDPRRLAKSGIFAAYSAHGLLPIISSDRGTFRRDGLKSNIHYLNLDSAESNFNSMQNLQSIADKASAWYKSHDLAIQSRLFLNSLIG